MSLKTNIDNSIKDAMRAKDQDRLRTLRAIKSLILLEETSATNTGGELSADVELKLLTKAAKQRRDSLEIFVAQGRTDLADKEQIELTIIEELLPKQLTEDELKAKLEEIKARVGASAPSDMGKMMGVATKELAGLADGKVVSAMVKALLA
ncbi:MAG: GatB/YqeY domain-containing protein [Bacteroidota bacterium]